jgi:hypothetical protein
MTTTMSNGQTRKTLATQLDRLEQILDRLGDSLNTAVATAVEGAVERAVRQAVGQAVKETLQTVIAETLTSPDLHAALRGVMPAATADHTADPPERPQGAFRRACDGVKAGIVAAGTAVVGQAAAVKAVAGSGWQLARRFRGPVLAACGVGVIAGVITFCAGSWLGFVAASVGGFVVSLVVQARNALRNLLTPTPEPATS